MAFDGITICALTYELNEKLTDGRIDKVLQPEKDEVILLIRAGGQNHRLLISASSFAPRVHLTEIIKENPETPPLFCMLLRKHISGGRVVRFYQPEFERILVMEIESRDEMGDLSIKSLYIEIMGRHSNLILSDAAGKILGCIKNVDISVSSLRQVLIGLTYHLPPSQNKQNPITTTKDDIFTTIDHPLPADKVILEGFTGISPLISRELAHLGLGDTSADLSRLDYHKKQEFAVFLFNSFANWKTNQFTSILLTDSEKKKLFDFSPLPITQYSSKMEISEYESLSHAIDNFFMVRDQQARAAQRSADLQKFVSNNIARCQKKLSLLGQELSDTKNKEKYKIKGDILIANLYQIKDRMENITLNNYYTNEPITITLKPNLSPSQNAQRYYHLYSKAKTAEIRLKEQIMLCEEELEYLESVQNTLDICITEKELNEIRDELVLSSYMVRKAVKGKIRKSPPASEPLHFTTSDGFDVYVGKNNLQNDRLTMKTAKANDLWFHVKDWPGSHTILAAKGNPFSENAILQAAQIAARHSKAKNSSNVPIDYTQIKNVKKPSGAKPGFVIYDHYKTIYVSP